MSLKLMVRSGPGPLNLITDIAGLVVGQATDELARTGVTVILPDRRTACAVDSRGGAPGTRETDALAQENLVEEVDAIVLSGGSVYGLAAADAVVAALGARGRGYSLASGAPPAPVVPAAILYDLANGGAKNWGDRPPYHGLGTAALEAASTRFELGSAGAGLGARAGGLQGGLGSTSATTADGFTVGAIAAVNSMGSVLVPGTGTFWASRLEIGGEFGRSRPGEARVSPDQWGLAKRDPSPGANTTIACVATDAALGRRELKRIAIMAHDGLAMAIRPCHTPFDGDVVFSLA
ncbi:MAG: P1 family peptidase, partial [Caulobacteraceae bacterium]